MRPKLIVPPPVPILDSEVKKLVMIRDAETNPIWITVNINDSQTKALYKQQGYKVIGSFIHYYRRPNENKVLAIVKKYRESLKEKKNE